MAGRSVGFGQDFYSADDACMNEAEFSGAKPHLAVFLATSGHSGVDRVMKNLLPSLAARGIRIDLLHVENHGPALENDHPNIRVIPLGSAHVNTCLLPLLRYLKANKPAVLLADKDKLNRLAIFTRALARVPTRVAVRLGITVSENLKTRKAWQRFLQLQSIRRLYRHADAVIVPSQGVAADLAKCGHLALEHISVVPNPSVTPQMLRLAEEPVEHAFFNEKKHPVVLSVGELSTRKDYATLIRAVALLNRTRPCNLIILGRGRQLKELQQLAASLTIGAQVSFPGFVTNPYAYMRQADVFALTSKVEGFGMVLAEAMATGTPVVSTNCPNGPSEILDHGRYGRLVPVGDAPALALALEATLAEPVNVQLLQEAVARYTVQTSTDAYMNVLGLKGDA